MNKNAYTSLLAIALMTQIPENIFKVIYHQENFSRRSIMKIVGKSYTREFGNRCQLLYEIKMSFIVADQCGIVITPILTAMMQEENLVNMTITKVADVLSEFMRSSQLQGLVKAEITQASLSNMQTMRGISPDVYRFQINLN